MTARASLFFTRLDHEGAASPSRRPKGTGPKQVAGLASEPSAELREGLKRDVLPRVLEARERGAADPEAAGEFVLTPSGLLAEAPEGLRQQPPQVHAGDSCLPGGAHVNILPTIREVGRGDG
jgi:hypothetical protein